ncbi:ral GTPase-activating protein subunit alpha-1-like isoform X1 [Branchiostoma lanceolatum]|uniref:ral GTPase-activating protein subunit alpha-1-like isoform X1 n=1 Tax=Branchiostoma lanceolatum TaxID=7740 RepID=UPI00345589B4
MFKKAHGDVKKSTQKVLDPKKDSVTRLKHLRTVLENTEQDEVKQFFDLYYSHIYQVFYDNFILVETSLRQKAHKAQREELDAVLFVFEKILTLLPDLIHQRWQFHSIGRLMKKMLHPGNSLKLRREGVRLYMLWLQALQENASEECLLIFACLIPGFPSPSSDSGMYTLEGLVTGAFHNGSASDAVVPTEISAVLTPQSGERVTDDQTKFFLDAVLEFMVIQVRKLEWKDAQFQPKGFNFLFQHFKQHYLTHIFPSMSSTTSLYQPNLVIPQPRTHRQGDRTDSARGGDPYLSARVSVIRWVVAFTHELRKPPQSPTGTSQGVPHDEQQKKHILTQKNLEESSEKAASSQDTADTRADTGEQSHSNTSTLTEKEPSTSSISSLEEGVHSELSDSDMVKAILFSSRRNVDFVHEMLRQGMLLPFTETSAVRKVIKVYQDWIQQDHPVFMEEPDQFVCSPMLGIASDPSSQPQDSPLQQETSTDGPPQVASEAETAGYPLRKSQSKSRLRAASYVGAINTAVSEEEGVENVRAGKNPTLQVFFTNSANIFLIEPSYQEAKLVDDQVDMCKKVLNIYRWTVMNVQMDKKTWEQLLLVLLRITEATLKDQPVGRGKNTLGGRLAAALFQTLIVTWIKACLNVHISHELWDQLLRVLSSLTQWEELITEWAKTIETLTRVLARQVYGLDLNDLPLDKLSEQKAKRRKGKGIPVSKKTRTAERSFSRGWSRYEGNKEKAEQMRHRSATTVGAGASRESNIQQAAARARIGGEENGQLQEPQPADAQLSSSYPTSEMAESTALVGRHRPKLERTRSQSGEPAMMQEDSQYPLVRSSSASDIMEEFARDRLRVDSIDLQGEDMGSHDSLDEFIKQRLQGQSFSSETSAVSTDTTCSVGDVVIGALGSEDKEVASYCTLGDTASEDSVTLGHSGDSSTGHRTTPESATMSRGSATPSPSSPTSPSSRTPSPTILLSPSPTPSPTAMLESSPEQIPGQNHSPAAESMKIDGEVLVELDSSEVQSEDSSVVTGGSLQGWFPDAAVIVWRRMLGILGDVNEIQDPEIHSQVFDYLCELSLVLMKLRENLGITTDNLATPPPPELLPPLNEFAPWLFKAISLPNKYKKGQLFAYKLLCRTTIRRHDTELSKEHLALFFHALHHGLLSADQDIVNVLVKNCCPLFFALDLSGSSMLVLDFIHAANTVANSSDMNAPRSEAQALLGSLLCIPNLLHDMPVLHPTSAETATMTCKDVKDHIVNILLKSGKKEPNVQARCTVLSCLGIYLYEELAHSTHHPKMKDAINVLLASLKFNHKTVAQVASDMLLLLAQQVDRLAHLQNDLPKKITESIALTITSLLSSPETSTTEADKKVVVSMLFCLLEWCMALPISVLLTTSAENKRSLILTVFKVLQTAVQGASSPRHSVVLSELESICLDSVKDVTGRSEPASPATPPGVEQGILEEETTSSPSFEYPQEGLDMVSLAARTVLSHLVDHIGHFPLGGGPAVLNSLVHEIDDCPELTFMDDLTLEIFQAPNVQFFVLNNKNIISVVEIPAEDLPGGGATGGLTTGKTQARLIVRDIGGKYAWDCSILWGPPRCRTGSCQAPVQLGSTPLHDPSLGPEPGQGGETDQDPQAQLQPRNSGTMPAWDNTPQHQDVLDEMLQYIGHTSPECLQKPGEPLNEPAFPPEEIVAEREDSTIQAVLQQRDIEADYVGQHINDSSMVASDMTETCSYDPKSPFHHCRFLLSQLGMLAWEKRPHLDLLRKNDRLLRELKNLDSRHCRETHKIAVIYVAEGQEDKHSILSNPGGSQAYEDFVAGLAWEVDLTGHRGFMGGLQRNRSTGDTAPYYATSTMEVIFHVATRMPTTTDDSRTKKLRHLGNDEVHIVWSEHTRDYRHGIIATEFGDVLIVIYPLSNHLYRIQIRRKPQVPFFGPLFDGAIVDYKVLPDLVRATAINASRAKRANIPLYQRFYEERAKYVETIVQQHKDLTTFEEFSASVYAPAMGKGAEASSGGSQRDTNQSDAGQGGAEGEGGVTLRHQQGSPKLRHRMSMKIRRSSGPKLPHSSSSSTTPPESPNVRGKKT